MLGGGAISRSCVPLVEVVGLLLPFLRLLLLFLSVHLRRDLIGSLPTDWSRQREGALSARTSTIGGGGGSKYERSCWVDVMADGSKVGRGMMAVGFLCSSYVGEELIHVHGAEGPPLEDGVLDLIKSVGGLPRDWVLPIGRWLLLCLPHPSLLLPTVLSFWPPVALPNGNGVDGVFQGKGLRLNSCSCLGHYMKLVPLPIPVQPKICTCSFWMQIHTLGYHCRGEEKLYAYIFMRGKN